MEVDEPTPNSSVTNNEDVYSDSDSDSDDDIAGPISVTAQKPSIRPLPPTSELNSPLAILSHFVHCIMDSWTGYQVALSQKCGGAETPEKDEWLREELVKFLKSSNLEVDDLVEWLEDILSEDFDLILEDGSTTVAARGLLRVVGLVRERFITKSARPVAAQESGSGVSERDSVLVELKTIVESLNF